MQSKEQVILGALLVNPDILNHLKLPENFFLKRDDQKIFAEIKKGNEVLLKVASVGICGSDIHYFKEGAIGTSVVNYPFRIGHEFSAVVHETGSDVTRLKPGDKVAVDPAVSCGTCDQCRAGRFNLCRTLPFMGSPQLAEGCLAEYVTISEEC